MMAFLLPSGLARLIDSVVILCVVSVNYHVVGYFIEIFTSPSIPSVIPTSVIVSVIRLCEVFLVSCTILLYGK